jgi:PKD repeat protein
LDGSSTNGVIDDPTNVVTAIRQETATLQSTSASASTQANALRYLLHFVGDIQQPMHASTGVTSSQPTGDAGGNGFSLKGTWSNLHKLWDAGGGYLTDGMSVSSKAAAVEADYPYVNNAGTIPDPMDWARDSRELARTNAYVGITNGGTPSTFYVNSAKTNTQWRMAMGGQRLANLLNTIFATNVAGFTASPTNGTAPLSVTFTDTSTGSITNRFWNFGDGSLTNFTVPTNPTHTYAAGSYSVTLIVSGSGGSSTNTKSNHIVVNNSSSQPVAGFTVSPTNGAAPLSVSFTDTSTGGAPTSWSWSFGDGTTSTAQNPANTYINPGAYSAQLIASNAGGWSTNSATIHVYSPYNWWQLFYFGATNNAGDGPGMSNTNKFLAGFNPTNPAAYLHIISIAATNTTDINVIYLGSDGDSTYEPGVASRTNVLEFTSGAADGSYASDNFASTGQTNILSGGTGLGVVTNMVDTGGATNFPSRYYRVRVLVP